ncbi:unnamed protein product [Brachionus calyciflorus]|uniref:Uncharacterized protein n=1 Tax=Brachionus calyciflorus TaxID=104777 RepID=A0A813Q051_9BILA|nr:unnamed protein product [Brachionus calyciflorus]
MIDQKTSYINENNKFHDEFNKSDETRNFSNAYTIKNYNLKELSLSVQYLACLNKDRVLLERKKSVHKPLFISETRLRTLNNKLVNLYYIGKKTFKMDKLIICYFIIIVIILDTIQLYSIKSFNEEVKDKSVIIFGVT